MDGNGNEPQGVQIVPGMHVAPVPMTASSRAVMGPDGKMVVLHMEHACGSSVFVMPVEFAKAVARGIQEAAGGLVIPA